MERKGTNYQAGIWTADGSNPKAFLGQELGLTGSELSLSFLKRGTGNAFVHSHKRNEEVYIVVSGNGLMHVDGEEFPLAAGSVVRVAGPGKRALKAADDADLVYYCVQADTGSLRQATANDGVLEKHPTSWLPA
jgi:mannose-6-phosphate isomerase-like protein (cupin superfamily)